MALRKIITSDERYLIIIEEHQNYNEYYVYETFDRYDIQDILDANATDFHYKCLKDDIKHQVNISVKWDGCSDMNSMVDGIMTHFCCKSHIDSLYNMINVCYEDARKRFSFED